MKIYIKIMKTIKKIFILDLELGGDVFIPNYLSQKNLPLSFRFYDPILKIV
jgi:hypothetical protein